MIVFVGNTFWDVCLSILTRVKILRMTDGSGLGLRSRILWKSAVLTDDRRFYREMWLKFRFENSSSAFQWTKFHVPTIRGWWVMIVFVDNTFLMSVFRFILNLNVFTIIYRTCITTYICSRWWIIHISIALFSFIHSRTIVFTISTVLPLIIACL